MELVNYIHFLTISPFAISGVVRFKHFVVLFATTWAGQRDLGCPEIHRISVHSSHRQINRTTSKQFLTMCDCVTIKIPGLWKQNMVFKNMSLSVECFCWLCASKEFCTAELADVDFNQAVSVQCYHGESANFQPRQLHSTMVSWSRLDGFSVAFGNHLGIVAEDLPSMEPKSLLSKPMSVTYSKFGFQQCWPLW